MSSVEEKVRGILSQQLGVGSDEITLDSTIVGDLGADSLDIVELVMSLEEDFDILIEDEEMESLVRVGDIINFVTKEIAKNDPPTE